MTTVAFKAGILAVDSMATDDSGAVYIQKWGKSASGDVVACAGDVGECAAYVAWHIAGRRGEVPAFGNSCAIYTVAGVPYLASSAAQGAPIKGACAIGSGAQGALVAMKLGLSAQEAVAAVAGVDTCTGGDIDVLQVEHKPRRTRK